MAEEHYCVSCEQTVRPRQEAIQCDNEQCKRWTHRTCGTGIDRNSYRAAVRESQDIPFTCQLCRQISNFSAIPDNTSAVTSTGGPLESTRRSLEASSNTSAEVGQFGVDFNISSNSSFDVTRDRRSIQHLDNENSIADETIREIIGTAEADITYQIVETGSERGKRKLVSSDGYSFVHKRIQKNGTIVWRCSVRGRTTGCPVTVNQKDEDFEKNGKDHVHPAKPGIATSVIIKANVKQRAKEEMFEPASAMVKDITDVNMDHILPEASRPTDKALVRICNRTRASRRPQDPSDLKFVLNEEYIKETISEPFFREDVQVGERRHLIFATNKEKGIF